MGKRDDESLFQLITISEWRKVERYLQFAYLKVAYPHSKKIIPKKLA